MDNVEEHYERIEQYLTNSLPLEEKKAFELELQQDPALVYEVELHRQLQGAIQRELLDNQMAQVISKAEEDYFAEQPQEEKVVSIPYSPARWYWLAASIVLALLIGVIYSINNSAPSNQELFASNFTVYEAPVLFRSGDTDSSATLQTAFVAYNQKDYQKAVYLFEKRLQENPQQITPHFYIGQCKLALNNPKASIPAFLKVIAHGNNAYLTQAKWYLALAYIDTSKEKEATQLLHELNQQKGPFSEKAAHLLEELSNNK